MTITENFSGDNPSGMITGDNSGVVPDNVMRSTWWVDFGLKSQVKISNLNHTWAYTFVFFASRNGDGDRTSVYTINGQSVSLNASFNTMQTVQIDNVRSDENGEVFIDVSLGQYAQYAYIGALMIHGYQTSQSGDDVISSGGNSRSIVNDAEKKGLNQTRWDADIQTQALITNAGVFPNPFNEQLTVSASFDKEQQDVIVRLVDMSGRTIYERNVGTVAKGNWNYRLDFDNKQIQPGAYLLQILSPDTRKQPVTFKLMRTK
jgi:hypothetical protein